MNLVNEFGQYVLVLWSPITSGCIDNKIFEPIKTMEYGNKTKLMPSYGS